MKLFFIISSLLSVVLTQEPISCIFRNYGQRYECDLRIYNPNGLNNFTEIEGIHLDGFTNSDVTSVYGFGYSTNVPDIICNTFPRVLSFEFFGEVSEIGDSTFSNCSRLTNLVLSSNRISSISSNAFVNLRDITNIDLFDNLLTTLPEHIFTNQQNLTTLLLSYNPFEVIPVGLFRPLENLQHLDLNRCNLNGTINQIFATNTRMSTLILSQNRITLSVDSFVGLEQLENLYLGYNFINEIPAETFASTPNLRSLYLYGNTFTQLLADSLADLELLTTLNIASNPIEIIHDNAFRGLENLSTLTMYGCRLRQLNSSSFEHLRNLTSIDLRDNQIEELEQGVFVPMPNLIRINLSYNNVKTIRRTIFGNLTNLRTLDLESNIVNALDRALIDDVMNLDLLNLHDNLCANGFFGNFMYNRLQYLPLLERCFSNFMYIVDTITDGDSDYQFFEGPYPGIALRVNADSEVQVALTPFNFTLSQAIEVIIGTENNTQSVIRVNQDTNVVTVSTTNIIVSDQWNDFRITWANENILVFRGNDSFPFMSFTMQESFHINFYGLRALKARATWSVQPFQ